MNSYNQTGPDSFSFGHYNATNYTKLETQVCYMKNFTVGNYTLWQIYNPTLLHLPLVTMQLSLMMVVTRIVVFILRPLRQTRFVAELIAAILIGPTLFRRFKISNTVFDFDATVAVDTFANLGLTYYTFMVGLEMDLSALRNIEKKSVSIAIAVILIPLVVGAGLYFVTIGQVKDLDGESAPVGAMFWAIILCNTSFPDLARILANVKLLHTDLGKLALTIALISDLVTWILLIMTITFSDVHRFYMAVAPTTIFLLACWFLIRPGIEWIITQNKKKGFSKTTHSHLILVGVAICGCISDACGTHSMIGGFMLGLIIPHGELANDIMQKIHEFVDGIMLPAFLLGIGQLINLHNLISKTRWRNLALVTLSATSIKTVSTLLVSLFFDMSSMEALALGVLLNTKGVLAIIVLREGGEMEAVDNIGLHVMGFLVLLMTFMVPPVFFLVKKSTRRLKSNSKPRTIQRIRSKADAELRILTCVYSTRNISSIINLLKISRATVKSPICVFLIHLVELTRHASAMLIMHDTSKSVISSCDNNNTNRTRERAESEQIINAFRNYESVNDAVTVHPFTVVSPYTTMHKDIFHLIEDRDITFILVPYHKLPSIDGGLYSDNLSIREVNKNLLINAPCSIGIVVDRGLGSFTHSNSIIYDKSGFRLAMFFLGGPDDHEALSYAMRMAKTSGVTLTVVRFLQSKDKKLDIHVENKNSENEVSTSITECKDSKEIDDDFINEFRFKTMCEQSVTYQEKVVNSGHELLELVSSLYNDFDLYIVGRGSQRKSPLLTGLSEWSDSPELGLIGETLVKTHATEHASVLVVQQFTTTGLRNRLLQCHTTKFGGKKWTSPILNPGYEAFICTHGKPIK